MLDNELSNTFACPALGTHYATVGVPVTVKPFAVPGPVSVECCGQPVVSNEETCRGKIGSVCHFTIAQRLKIDIPVDFGASVKVGDTYVDCEHFGIGSDAPGTLKEAPVYSGVNTGIGGAIAVPQCGCKQS
ncbi:MAG: hypothetical protein LBO63_02175 [Oscillospiraceae bacterium]|nr:hypothetical protein [Oscillospiraceae bacterium]